MKLVRDILKDMFAGRRVRMISSCEIAPVDIIGVVEGVGLQDTEPVFFIKSDKNGRVYKIGARSKDLMYEFR